VLSYTDTKKARVLRTACERAGPEGRVGDECEDPASELHMCQGDVVLEDWRSQCVTGWVGVRAPVR
jgi:hypothetical protein